MRLECSTQPTQSSLWTRNAFSGWNCGKWLASSLKRVFTENIVLVNPKIRIFPHFYVTISEDNACTKGMAASRLFLWPICGPTRLLVGGECHNLGEITASGNV